ncbi:MAG: twin-arginine translocase TatA/TatE family subunit [Caldilineaceae bacterium SB0662_bin_9]|uniref:Sec-independent protein translocase protein TatA n=1 Tax=Caldilineaceae bacterium SB0662_bin_9 TaxID=2605258 RepID=A0A6B1DS85_9CHLR|nr:twin-arginine translocase TatA/TatE family subunit [Caldilineaceae bacterium]MXZ25958.1 twin-arginine translocase TatA/TatE family subunit [Caldilineaceae bacterium SB0665_bin_21]MYA03327.1 twin-arginine translocase TatA/TatE family subunit [Caldilineaceae bacterium SB0664_bin_22]MYC62814.1 twin-arginine translocase TatA/TatE family subunit [Caldilineaceae bacterium SB0661_bin_34]MYD89675.1 twin-arginine translocase TatA/TatE family subunit [Caldilineaceae bacterium SB0662_bin_9]
MPNLGPLELGIILVIVIMIFGVGRLPEVGGAVGKTIREFRRNMGNSDDKKEANLLEDDEDNFEDDVDGEVTREEKASSSSA